MAVAALRQTDPPARRARWLLWLAPAAVVALVVIAMLGFALAIGGGELDCLGIGGGPAGPQPSRSAIRDIPPARLILYRQAGRRFDIDWTFLASIGAQECDHGRCAGDNGSGCAGPMQIAFRRGSPCSPGAGATLWERYRTDGDGDGRTDIDDPADAIFTAARVLREAKGAPAASGTYAQYRQAACNYYGACSDASASYADTVMARAVQYGFHGPGSPHPTDPDHAEPAPDQSIPPGGGSGCGASGDPVSAGALGPVVRQRSPRRLAPLPAAAIAPGSGAIHCDARIVANVAYLARRFRVRVTACYGIHSLAGEHPLGAAIDAVPGSDGDWTRVLRLARAAGWKQSCAASGLAPACAKPPFRFIAYNGFPNHGDPAHCIPCAGGPHLHISWHTSASPGEPENQPRTGYFPPSWIDVFTTAAAIAPEPERANA